MSTKRINLTKFGLVRAKELDFDDDGNYFRCYTFGKYLRVSILKASGDYYLSASIRRGGLELPSESYIHLPSYQKAAWSLNGVSESAINDEVIKDWVKALESFEKELEEAALTIKWPTCEEIITALQDVRDARKAELDDLSSKFKMQMLLKMGKYDAEMFIYDLSVLERNSKSSDAEIAKRAELVYQKAESVYLIKNRDHDVAPSYHYTSALKLIEKCS